MHVITKSILNSFNDMASIILLLLIINFVFAVLAIQLFGEALPEYFGDIPSALFTLFIFMTQDGWVDIYEEMEEQGVGTQGAIFSFVYLVIGAIIFTNIVVGVIVIGLQTVSEEEKHAKLVKHRALTGEGDLDQQVGDKFGAWNGHAWTEKRESR